MNHINESMHHINETIDRAPVRHGIVVNESTARSSDACTPPPHEYACARARQAARTHAVVGGSVRSSAACACARPRTLHACMQTPSLNPCQVHAWQANMYLYLRVCCIHAHACMCTRASCVHACISFHAYIHACNCAHPRRDCMRVQHRAWGYMTAATHKHAAKIAKRHGDGHRQALTQG